MAPATLDLLLWRAGCALDEGRWLVAAQRADFWNANRAKDAELVSPADFMGIAPDEPDEDAEPTPEQAQAFRRAFGQIEREYEGIGKVTRIGPRGIEQVRVS
jgi:hypothetical protein